ncbi:MAG: leucyl/phenylalanyl-tRNA--protein transferase [Burkholderiales bacterium]
MIPWITRGARFPSPNTALVDPDGLLCAGGDLRPATIVAAYSQGIFPWFSDGQPILWWTPDPRMVLFPEEFKLSRSLTKTIRQQKFEVTFNVAFRRVIENCAAPREPGGGTWIVEQIQDAYTLLHNQGFAHSVESWAGDQLVGGLYGVAIGQAFFGESMFTRQTDASKVAFATLVDKLTRDGFRLIDCQQQTRHLASFGARPIPRAEFLQRLAELINSNELDDHRSAWKPCLATTPTF